jgi:Fe-coproporphyrin III synthase
MRGRRRLNHDCTNFGEMRGVMRPLQLEPFLFLYITEKCQLRCTHCYMGERLDHERTMTPELVQEILRSLKIISGQYKVYLLGGEPTTHPELSAILDICKDCGYKVVLTSNGLIPETAWREIRVDRIDSLSFSLDGGTPAVHEQMRGRNTFQPLLVNMKRAVAGGLQTRAIFTVTTENEPDVPAALALADEIGLDMVSFHYFTPTGYGQSKPQLQLSPDRWIALCERLTKEALRRRTKIFYPPAFVRPDGMPSLLQRGYRGCTARNLERLAIFPDRRVYICSAFFDTDLHYGVFEGGRIVPRHSSLRGTELTLVNNISSNCATCSHAEGCRAGCAAYDYFERTCPSANCKGDPIPICPLWSVPATPTVTDARFQDLR